MVAHRADIPIEFGEGAAFEEAFIGCQVRRRDQGRLHDLRCVTVVRDKLKTATRYKVVVKEQDLYEQCEDGKVVSVRTEQRLGAGNLQRAHYSRRRSKAAKLRQVSESKS